MIVYHFLDARYGLEDIERRRLKVSRADSLNDPFDHLGLWLGDREMRHHLKIALKEAARQQGLICFSESYNSPVMWSHYADRHRGICLGFEIAKSDLTKIRYTRDLLRGEFNADFVVRPDETDLMNRLIKTKFDEWSYEREQRLFVNLEKADFDGQNYFVSFGSRMRLKKVIVGTLSEVSPEDVQEALGSLSDEVECFKTRTAFRSFAIVRQYNDNLWR